MQSFGQGQERGWTEKVECDGEGRFSFPKDSPLRFMAQIYTPDLRESAILTNANESLLKTVRLKPSAEVTLKFDSAGEPAKGFVHIQILSTLSMPWGGDMDANGEVKLWMPQGEYAVTLRSDESDFAQENLVFKAGPQKFDLACTPNPFRKLRGQPAPELTNQDALGIEQSVKLADFRGRYVLLEFWGYWCGPCVESSIPGLIELHKNNPDLKSKLAILAIHENSGGNRTLKKIREHLPTFEREYWKGPLPFPIIVEKPASLTRIYGIRAYPTAVLIDPEGKVVDRADPASLRGLLGLR